jgi:alpha-L-glutamate ligase-like protein
MDWCADYRAVAFSLIVAAEGCCLMFTRLKALFKRYQYASQHLVGMNRRNAEYIYPNNARRDYPLVDDKILCKELLAQHGVPTAETLCICHGLFDVERTLYSLVPESNFVVKPANGSGGRGILVLGERLVSCDTAAQTEAQWLAPAGKVVTAEQLRSQLGNIVFGAFGRKLADRALIERRLVPHEYFRSLWPDGVCDLRVIVLGETPIMAMLRIPTRGSGGKANLHQGGIGVAVDIETGKTERASLKGQSLRSHPETGVELVGGTVPMWPRVLEVARLAASSVPLDYLGVDLVIDADCEPKVLELNARPGLEIQNVNGRSLEAAQSLAAARALGSL